MQGAKKKVQPKVTAKPGAEKPNLLELDRVIGNTAHANSFVYDDNSSLLAYPAGCVIVLFNTKRNKQTDFLASRTNKPISCLAFSRDGKYLAAGESGHQPAILVWDIQARTITAELKGHKYGIAHLAFTPNGRTLVSVGVQHDACINVWDLKTSTAVASAKLSGSITGLSVAEDSSFFVTVGMRHLKFWQLDSALQQAGQKGEGKPAAMRKAVALEGKYIVFGKESEDPAYQSFVDVSCTKDGSTYALTSGGILFEISSAMKIETMRLKNNAKGVCVSATERLVACGLKQSIVELWDPKTRQVHSFTGPAHILAAAQNDSTHRPDCVALRFSADASRLFALYSDRSIFVWDTKRPAEPVRVFALPAHADCIWDIDLATKSLDLPEGTFTTASADGSVRFWNAEASLSATDPLRVYGKEMHRCLSFVDLNKAPAAPAATETAEGEESASATTNQSELGVRCVRISRDGRLIASGDRQGNLRIHDVASNRQLHFCEAHDSEILSMDWSQDIDGHVFLATGGRDRIIHVFDSTDGWRKVESLADHSSSVTCVRFVHTEGETAKLISSGADKSIIFRSAIWKNKSLQLARYHLAVVPFGRVFHLDFDPEGKQMITSGQEKKLNLFNVTTGKAARTFKLDSDVGEVLKVELDPSGSFAATAGSDRTIRVYDYHTGELMGRALGHGDAVTGVKWLSNGSRLVSTSGDGSIFVYRTAQEISSVVLSRLSQASYSRVLKPLNADAADLLSFFDNHLPAWAKSAKTQESFHPARGRWAERVSVMVYSEALREVVSARPWTSKEERRLTLESKENTSVTLKEKTPASVIVTKPDEESEEDEAEAEPTVAVVSVAAQQPAAKLPEPVAVSMVAEVAPAAPKEEVPEKEEKKEEADDMMPLSRFSRFATFDLDDGAVNSRRQSLSAEFRRTAPAPAVVAPAPTPVVETPAAPATESAAPAAPVPEAKKAASILESAHISRKEEIAREVERTRMRLAKLGLIPTSAVSHRPPGSPNRKSPKKSPRRAAHVAVAATATVAAAVAAPVVPEAPVAKADAEPAPAIVVTTAAAEVAAVAEAVTLSPVVAAPADKTPEAAPESVATPVADAVTAEPKTIAEEPVVVPIEKPAEAAAVQSEITPIAAVPSDEASAEGAAADADFVDADNGDEAAEEDEGEGDDAANEEEAAEDEEEEVCVPDEIPANQRIYHDAITKLEENFDMIFIIHEHLKAQQAAADTRTEEGDKLLASFSSLFSRMQERLVKETQASAITHYSELLLAAVKSKLGNAL